MTLVHFRANIGGLRHARPKVVFQLAFPNPLLLTLFISKTYLYIAIPLENPIIIPSPPPPKNSSPSISTSTSPPNILSPPIYKPPRILPPQSPNQRHHLPHALVRPNRPFLLPFHQARLHPPRMDKHKHDLRHIDAEALDHGIQRRLRRAVRVAAACGIIRHRAHARRHDDCSRRGGETQVRQEYPNKYECPQRIGLERSPHRLPVHGLDRLRARRVSRMAPYELGHQPAHAGTVDEEVNWNVFEFLGQGCERGLGGDVEGVRG